MSATVLLRRVVTSFSLFSLAFIWIPATAVSDGSTKSTTLLFFLFDTCYAIYRDLLMCEMGCQITLEEEYKNADGLKQLLCIILHAYCEVLCASLWPRSQKTHFLLSSLRNHYYKRAFLLFLSGFFLTGCTFALIPFLACWSLRLSKKWPLLLNPVSKVSKLW